MKRYTSSFFIALSIYALVGIFIFYTFKNENLIFKEIEKPKIISLSQVELEPKPIIEEKQTIQKKEVPNPPKKIVEEIKKEEPIIQKKPIQKKLPKKEIIKEVKEIKKEPVEKVKPQEKMVEESPKIKEEIENKPHSKVVETKDEKQEYLDKHLAKIRELINENIIYPKRAKKLNIQGIVTIRFKILEDGNIVEIEVMQGHKFLQKATIEAIQNASKLFPKVKNSIEIQIPIEFKLI